jgi:tetratricopeptide (TPR) repeat protein
LETLDMLGKAYLLMKDYKALPGVFDRIMKINPNSAAAYVMMDTAYDKMSDQPNAIKEYQAAEEADPISGACIPGWAIFTGGKAKSAISNARQAWPNLAPVHCGRTACRIRTRPRRLGKAAY